MRACMQPKPWLGEPEATRSTWSAKFNQIKDPRLTKTAPTQRALLPSRSCSEVRTIVCTKKHRPILDLYYWYVHNGVSPANEQMAPLHHIPVCCF